MTREKRILIAEDDFDTRVLYRTWINEYHSNITIDEAKDGEDEVRPAKQNEYDLIINDGGMRLMDRITAAETLRSWDRYPNTYDFYKL